MGGMAEGAQDVLRGWLPDPPRRLGTYWSIPFQGLVETKGEYFCLLVPALTLTPGGTLDNPFSTLGFNVPIY
jgi:hypothetical protein